VLLFVRGAVSAQRYGDLGKGRCIRHLFVLVGGSRRLAVFLAFHCPFCCNLWPNQNQSSHMRPGSPVAARIMVGTRLFDAAAEVLCLFARMANDIVWVLDLIYYQRSPRADAKGARRDAPQ
jgi:hypothetical protein